MANIDFMMLTHVVNKRCGLPECFRAVRARSRLLSSVRHRMPTKSRAVPEGFSTGFAFERLFASMRAHVHFEVRGTSKRSVTHQTETGFGCTCNGIK